MKIVVGSKNQAKWKAVQEVFTEGHVVHADVPSMVSKQPFSDQETRNGAINRAMRCADVDTNAIGIGLEGGVVYVAGQLYLCNWGALVTKGRDIYTASGARIALPSGITDKLEAGYELGDIMDDYAGKQKVRTNEGAIGIFTNESISRKAMFVHVVHLLRGQWGYWSNK